jgi:hypothetical protein
MSATEWIIATSLVHAGPGAVGTEHRRDHDLGMPTAAARMAAAVAAPWPADGCDYPPDLGVQAQTNACPSIIAAGAAPLSKANRRIRQTRPLLPVMSAGDGRLAQQDQRRLRPSRPIVRIR